MVCRGKGIWSLESVNSPLVRWILRHLKYRSLGRIPNLETGRVWEGTWRWGFGVGLGHETVEVGPRMMVVKMASF